MSEPIRWSLAALLLVLLACTAETDRSRYAVGDPVRTSFLNDAAARAYLPGCLVFALQKREGGVWTNRGFPWDCFWEGFAMPVAPGERFQASFSAPADPGTWRLLYTVGARCSEDQPLSEDHCAALFPVATPAFVIAELCEPGACGPPLGMPNVLCSDGTTGGPTDRCLRDPDSGACGWEVVDCREDE